MRFVIHEHYATTHHFDLRLEHDGALRSWALPKGIPVDSARNRLAVHVDDHDLDHLTFEDLTPVESAPAGTVAKSIWDHGTFETVRSTDDKMVIDLRGERTQARFSLFRTGGNQWMMHLMNEESHDGPTT